MQSSKLTMEEFYKLLAKRVEKIQTNPEASGLLASMVVVRRVYALMSMALDEVLAANASEEDFAAISEACHGWVNRASSMDSPFDTIMGVWGDVSALVTKRCTELAERRAQMQEANSARIERKKNGPMEFPGLLPDAVTDRLKSVTVIGSARDVQLWLRRMVEDLAGRQDYAGLYLVDAANADHADAVKFLSPAALSNVVTVPGYDELQVAKTVSGCEKQLMDLFMSAHDPDVLSFVAVDDGRRLAPPAYEFQPMDYLLLNNHTNANRAVSRGLGALLLQGCPLADDEWPKDIENDDDKLMWLRGPAFQQLRVHTRLVFVSAPDHAIQLS